MNAAPKNAFQVIAPATAEQIASKAATLVSGDRAKTHGDKTSNFNNIASLWTAWLGIHHDLSRPLRGSDVAKMMVLLKLARMEGGAFNVDDSVDAAGYAAIAGELARQEQ